MKYDTQYTHKPSLWSGNPRKWPIWCNSTPHIQAEMTSCWKIRKKYCYCAATSEPDQICTLYSAILDRACELMKLHWGFSIRKTPVTRATLSCAWRQVPKASSHSIRQAHTLCLCLYKTTQNDTRDTHKKHTFHPFSIKVKYYWRCGLGCYSVIMQFF